MDQQVRKIKVDELEPFLLASELASSVVPDRDEIERERSIAEPERNFAAFAGPDIVGTAGAFTMPITIPGGELVTGYLTLVGVLPTHRRRGIAAELMRALLDDARERGELFSVLYASEGGIYGRYGYGLGTIGLTLRIETARSAFVRGYSSSGQIRFAERERATRRSSPCTRRRASNSPGWSTWTSGGSHTSSATSTAPPRNGRRSSRYARVRRAWMDT